MTRSSFFLYAFGLLALAFLTRVHALWIPVLDIDETQFIGFAQVLLDGGLPYLDSTDTKPPMIYWVVAAILKFFGRNNLLAVHIATIVWVWITSLAIYGLAAQLFNRKSASYAGLFYILFTAGFETKFISTSITQFMNLPLVLGTLFFSRGCVTPGNLKRGLLMTLAGLLTAVAFNFKYQGGIQLPILMVGLFLMSVEGGLPDRGHLTLDLVGLVAGFILGTALIWGPLYLSGVWPHFVEWSLIGSVTYIRDGRHSWMLSFVSQTGWFILSMLPLVLLAGRGVRTTANSGERRKIFFVLLWLVATFIPVSVGGRFYGHYFLQLLPPLVILAATGVVTLNLQPKIRLLLVTMVLLFVIVPMSLRFFYPQMMRLRGEETFEVHQKVGVVLKTMAATHAKPASLFIWGFATPIYTFSDLPSSSRFLWTDFLSGRSSGPRPTEAEIDEMVKKGSPKAWGAFWEDMEKRPPRFFVDTSPAAIHDYEFFPVSRYPKLQSWLDRNFTFCREVDHVRIYCKKE